MKQKGSNMKKTEYNRQLTYIRHKDNYPLQLKGNMKKKIIPSHKQVKIPSIKTYNDGGLSSSKSTSVISALLLKSDSKCSSKQRRHFPTNPETINRYESMKSLGINANRVTKSKYRKITEDFEDHINFQDMGSNKRSTSQEPQMRTGKRIFPNTNLFIQSQYLGKNTSKYSQRRVNLNRTRSSVLIN